MNIIENEILKGKFFTLNKTVPSAIPDVNA
jgi:hypothetical protein